jgi:hypothetical protein
MMTFSRLTRTRCIAIKSARDFSVQLGHGGATLQRLQRSFAVAKSATLQRCRNAGLLRITRWLLMILRVRNGCNALFPSHSARLNTGMHEGEYRCNRCNRCTSSFYLTIINKYNWLDNWLTATLRATVPQRRHWA